MILFLKNIWTETDGLLSFEWTLLVTLVVFGIVAGLTVARDGIIEELADTAGAIGAFDQSYSMAGIGTIPPSEYEDPGVFVTTCARDNSVQGQPAVIASY